MASASVKIQTGIAKAFTKMSAKLDPTKRIFLLKRASKSSVFTPIVEITTGWFVRYNNYREQMEFQFATTSTEFQDQFAQTSFIGYGTPNLTDEIDVFEIREQDRDKLPRTGRNPLWKALGIRMTNERYTIE